MLKPHSGKREADDDYEALEALNAFIQNRDKTIRFAYFHNTRKYIEVFYKESNQTLKTAIDELNPNH